MGIYNTDDMQIVFSDTPGVLKPSYKLQESMLNFSTSALTDADVLAAIRAFIKQLNKHLAAGKIVRAENLGSFQLQIQSTGAETEKEFTVDNITGVTIQFRPGKTVATATTKGLAGLQFKRVAKKGETLPTEPDAGGSDDGQEESPL